MIKGITTTVAGTVLLWAVASTGVNAGAVNSAGGGSDSDQAASTAAPQAGATSSPAAKKADDSVEVVVMAQRKSERLQETPVSVSAVSAQNFENLNARDVSDVSRAAPNIQFEGNSGGSGLGTLTIRGVGQQQAGLLSDPGAAVYVDEVYRPRLSNNTLDFADISRLEVLRGPQGTLFGKNVVGGALSVYTALPDFEWGGKASVDYGTRDLSKVAVVVNAPIVKDVLALRIAGERVTQDGFMDDLATGQKLNNTNYSSYHATLLYNATDDLQFILRADTTYQNEKGTGGKVLTAPDPSLLTTGDYETRGTAPSFNLAKDQGLSLTTTVKNVLSGTFKSITAVRSFYNNFADDTDGTPLPLQSIDTISSETYGSQEFQYSNKLLDGKLNYSTGLYYMRENIKYDSFPRLAIFNLDNYSHQSTNSYAAYGQATYSATDKLDFTLGVRYSKDEKDVLFQSFATGGPELLDAHVKHAWDAVTPKGIVEYKFSRDFMAYGTISEGFKSGGVNGQPIQVSDFQPFGPEKVTNYEAGIKSELLHRRLRLNVSAYDMDYTNMQIGITAFGQNVVKNAGKAQIKGFEGDALLRTLPGLTFNANFSYNDFKYKYLTPDALASGLAYGSTLPVSPKTTINTGVEYSFDVGDDDTLTWRADYAYRTKIYFDANNSENLAQSAYGLWSSRLTFDVGRKWSVYAYGSNLTNKFYRVAAVTGLGATSVIPGRPREFGAGIKRSF